MSRQDDDRSATEAVTRRARVCVRTRTSRPRRRKPETGTFEDALGAEVLQFHFFVDPDAEPELHPKEPELESLGSRSMLESDPPLEINIFNVK